MKSFFSLCLFLALFSIVACDKDDDTVESTNQAEEIGTWQLIETLLDPGDGSGIFMPVNSDKTVQFFEDGTILSNGSLCNVAGTNEPNVETEGTYSTTEMTITLPDCNGIEHILQYEIIDGFLIVSFQCFEPCKNKYQKIE